MTCWAVQTCLPLKNIFNNIAVSFSWTQGSPPPADLDFGLCARVSPAVFLPLEPAIPFFHWSAVSPSKSRDFRLHEPTIPFSIGQRFPIPLPVMTLLDQSEASLGTIWAPFTTLNDNIPLFAKSPKTWSFHTPILWGDRGENILSRFTLF